MTTLSISATTVGDCQDCAPTSLVSRERSRFFPRQLVGADDLTQDQVYFREKLRRHNRLLHGWGIVCGATVSSDKCVAIVTPGYVLGPYGDEIMIDQETRIDVCKQDSVGSLDCGDGDVWCGDAPTIADDSPVYLAVRYVERATRPVRVPGCGCGCDDSDCEYSRMRDSFELKVLTELPASYRIERPAQTELWRESWSCPGGSARQACPPCPSDPWVILCDLTVSGGTIMNVDCNAHRRYVVSFADYSFGCFELKEFVAPVAEPAAPAVPAAPAAPAPAVAPAAPAVPQTGARKRRVRKPT